MGIHDERSLMASLESAPTLEEKADGSAILTGFDLHCRGHGYSFQEAEIGSKNNPYDSIVTEERPGTRLTGSGTGFRDRATRAIEERRSVC